ncbi:tetratricopeptide repeat protein [Entomospira entomophila]|uniref:Uncharacterized protein n=1 Tax=Entomospira entomophila TaxID=2719988 RepID=A0A968GA57_9SPIO|nr:tetratricopeptide repeat protein [Entomospira entomophilus]NIZ39908.1 hypothetical protein [Entomospira entomophilus]WDI35470.1 tetratricopeptide repeat protein [Entomospira entomophilus]
MRHQFLQLVNLILFIFFSITSISSNEQEQTQDSSERESAIEKEHSDNTNALIYHWLELARLYEQTGDTEMASMAYEQAKKLQKQPIIVKTLEEHLTTALFAYFSGWQQRDPQQILHVTAPLFLLPLYSNGLVKQEQVAFFSEFFATYPQLSQLSIEDFYDLNTIDVVQLDTTKSILSIRTHSSAPASIQEWQYWSNFWNNTHHYFFQKMADNKWYLLAFDMDEVGTSDLFFPGEKS